MFDRLFAIVRDQILLADIGDVAAFCILGEQVIEGLVLARSKRLGDGFVPFLTVRKDRIDVKNHPAKVEQPVPDNFADGETREWKFSFLAHIGSNPARTFEGFKRGHSYYLGNRSGRC